MRSRSVGFRFGQSGAALVLLLTACAAPPGGAPEAGAVSGASWESLARPRPEPLEGAARVTVSDLILLGSGRWSETSAGVTPAVGLQELISAGLLRRRDVHFVERRRFAEATDRERRGLPRPEGAPPIGRSPGAELVLTGTWSGMGADSAALELRLTRAETGEVVRAWRMATPADADLVSLARLATGGLLDALASVDRLPEWNDPLAAGGIPLAPERYRPAGVSGAAVDAFLRGVAAEDSWEWDEARRAYQRALELAGESFYEPDVALARAARLRTGGTLGASP